MSNNVFNPEKHLTKLPLRRKNPKTGSWDTTFADYLEVKWRMVWFRGENLEGTHTTIKDKIIDIESEFAYYELEITDSRGNIEIGVGSEKGSDFKDYIEKAYTKAYGRALAALGYGTQFSPDIDESERIVDSPVEGTNKDSEIDSITEPQQRAIFAISNLLGYKDDQMKDLIRNRYSKSDSKYLTKQEASNLIDYLNSLKPKG
ncbi:MAG: hypothetical protein GX974_09795 [Clostridiales bacterium]|nr:hypothetical protein [Clostridiales bacterium]